MKNKEGLIVGLLTVVLCLLLYAIVIVILVLLRWKFNSIIGVALFVFGWGSIHSCVKKQVHKYFACNDKCMKRSKS